MVLWRRNPPAGIVYWLTTILLAAGVLFTFPPFYDRFAG
jgi:hypothetical protein